MFTSDASTFLRTWLTSCWSFFGITIPGTTVTFGNLLIGCLLTVFVIKLVMNIFSVVPSTGERLTQKDKYNKGGKNDR